MRPKIGEDLVGGLEHVLFFRILGIIIPTANQGYVKKPFYLFCLKHLTGAFVWGSMIQFITNTIVLFPTVAASHPVPILLYYNILHQNIVDECR